MTDTNIYITQNAKAQVENDILRTKLKETAGDKQSSLYWRKLECLALKLECLPSDIEDIFEFGRQTKDFLKILEPSATCFSFQTFDDVKDRKDPALVKQFHNSFDNIWDTLIEYNIAGAGIFVTVNQTDLTGRKTHNIVRKRAIFQDDDICFKGEFPLKPSIIVQSSPKKYHRYWLISGKMPDVVFDYLENVLIEHFGADPGCKDLARVLRLPGYYHNKDVEFPHRAQFCSHLSPGNAYSARELFEAFSELIGKVESSRIWQEAVQRSTSGNHTRKTVSGAHVANLAISDAVEPVIDPSIARPHSPKYEFVRSALAALPQSFRDDWVEWSKVGFSLHDGMLYDGLWEAKQLFDDFSKASPKYCAVGVDTFWNSIEDRRVSGTYAIMEVPPMNKMSQQLAERKNTRFKCSWIEKYNL